MSKVQPSSSIIASKPKVASSKPKVASSDSKYIDYLLGDDSAAEPDATPSQQSPAADNDQYTRYLLGEGDTPDPLTPSQHSAKDVVERSGLPVTPDAVIQADKDMRTLQQPGYQGTGPELATGAAYLPPKTPAPKVDMALTPEAQLSDKVFGAPPQNRTLPNGTDLLAGKSPEEIAAMEASLKKDMEADDKRKYFNQNLEAKSAFGRTPRGAAVGPNPYHSVLDPVSDAVMSATSLLTGVSRDEVAKQYLSPNPLDVRLPMPIRLAVGDVARAVASGENIAIGAAMPVLGSWGTAAVLGKFFVDSVEQGVDHEGLANDAEAKAKAALARGDAAAYKTLSEDALYYRAMKWLDATAAGLAVHGANSSLVKGSQGLIPGQDNVLPTNLKPGDQAFAETAPGAAAQHMRDMQFRPVKPRPIGLPPASPEFLNAEGVPAVVGEQSVTSPRGTDVVATPVGGPGELAASDSYARYLLGEGDAPQTNTKAIAAPTEASTLPPSQVNTPAGTGIVRPVPTPAPTGEQTITPVSEKRPISSDKALYEARAEAARPIKEPFLATPSEAQKDPEQLAYELADRHDIPLSKARAIVNEASAELGAKPIRQSQVQGKPTEYKPQAIAANPDSNLTSIANEYNASQGLPPVKHEAFEVNEAHSKAIADFYDKAESTPDDPQVKAAYKALTTETAQQFKFLQDKGYTFEPSPHEPPYPDRESMAKDVIDNHHMFVSDTNHEHPILTPEQNFKFRAVHDTMAHIGAGATFGHGGEELAYRTHLQMYSPLAQQAMATETRGQNAAVHFGEKQGNDQSLNYSQKADVGFKFPEQKATILPEWLREPEGMIAGGKGEGFKAADFDKAAEERLPKPQGPPTLKDIAAKLALQEDAPAVKVQDLKNRFDKARGQAPSVVLSDEQTPATPPENTRKPGLFERRQTRAGNNLASTSGPKPNESREDARARIKYEAQLKAGEGPAAETRPTPRGTSVYINTVGKSLLVRAGLPPSLQHVTVDRENIGGVLTNLRDQLKRDGLLPFERKGLTEVIASIKQALVESPSGAPIKFIQKANETREGLRHEGNHVKLMAEHGFDPDKFMSAMIGNDQDGWDDVAEKAFNALRAVRYPEDHLAWELPAHLAEGNLKALDLTPDEAVDLYTKVLNEIGTQVGLDKALDIFKQSHPMFNTVLDEAKGRLNGIREKARSLVQTSTAALRTRAGEGSPGEARPVAGRIQNIPPGEVQGGQETRGTSESTRGLDTGYDSSGQPTSFERRRPSIDKHLTGQERQDTDDKAQALYDEFEKLPSTSDVKQAALAGAAGKYWYENSARAITAAVGEKDAAQFADLLAALSPRQPVIGNVRGAIATWREYVAEGRPTDEASLRDILSRPGVHSYVAMEARTANAIRVLQNDVEPLKGLKVSAFTQNLLDEVHKTTNDVHIARFMGVAQKVYSNPQGYLATSALIRKAATDLGWDARQVQAAVWSWARPFYEAARRKNVDVRDLMRTFGAVQKKDILDFGRIMQEDPEVRKALDDVLKQRGSSLEEFDKGFTHTPLRYGTEEAVSPKFSKSYVERAQNTIAGEKDEARGLAERRRLASSAKKGQGILLRRDPSNELASKMEVEGPGGTRRAVAGMDPRIMKVLGGNLYSGDLPKIALKESVQNAIDSVRELGANGKVHINIDAFKHSIEVLDNGAGMLPEVATRELVDIGGSKKSEGASGGFGIAKVAIFANSKEIHVSTVAINKEGKKIETVLTGSGEDWLDPDKGLHVDSREVPPETLTGTKMKLVMVPDQPIQTYRIRPFLQDLQSYPLHGMELTASVDGVPTTFDPARIEKVASLPVPGAALDVYASKETHKVQWGSLSVKILNKGLYQFTQDIHVGDISGQVPAHIVVDVRSQNSPEHADYPFRPDREGLRGDLPAVIKQYMNDNFLADAAAGEKKKLRAALTNAPNIVGFGGKAFKVVDTSGNTSPELLETIRSAPYLAPVVREAHKTFKTIQSRLAQLTGNPDYENAELSGIGLGEDYLGLNISGHAITGEETSKNLILLNPFVASHEISTMVNSGLISYSEAPLQLARSIVATIVHELTHQASRGHGEDFSGALTRNIQKVPQEIFKAAAPLAKLLTEKDAYNEIRNHARSLETQRSGENIFGKVSTSHAGKGRVPSGSESSSTGSEEGRPGHGEAVSGGREREAEELVKSSPVRRGLAERRKLASITSKSPVVNKLVDSGAGTIVTPKEFMNSGSRVNTAFIGSDGSLIRVQEHESGLEAAGLLQAPGMLASMKRNSLVRLQAKQGRPIAIEAGHKMFPEQIETIRQLHEIAGGPIIYELRGQHGKPVQGSVQDMDELYDAIDHANSGGMFGNERGFITLGLNKRNPLPNDAEYTKLHEAQNATPSMFDKLGELVKGLPDTAKDLYEKQVYKWTHVADVTKGLKDRGINVTSDKDAEMAANIAFGGGMGASEAAHLDMLDIRNAADKDDLLPEVTALLNIAGHERVLRSGKASSGLSLTDTARMRTSLARNLGPVKFKQAEAHAQKMFDANKRVLTAYYNAGGVSTYNYGQMLHNGDYSNMSRIMDKVEEFQGKYGETIGQRAQHGIKALKGTETLVNKDPWVANLDAQSTMLRDIARWEPIKVLHEMSKLDPTGFGASVRELPAYINPGRDEGVRYYYKDGKPVRIAMPKALADAYELASKGDSYLVGSALLGGIAKVSRASFTGLNLAYGLTAPVKQLVDSFAMIGKYGPIEAGKYVKAQIEALGHALKQDQVYRAALRAGVGYGSLQARIDPYVMLRGPSLNPLTNLAKFGHLIQTADKIGARQYLIDNGMDPVAATAMSRKFAGRPDVANAGTRSAQLNKLMLFLTDYMKGMERNGSFIKNNKGKFVAAVAAMMAVELALNRHNAQYPSPENDGTREIDHVSKDDLENDYVVLTPFATQTSEGGTRLIGLKFPRPKFLGIAVGRALQAALGVAFGDETKTQALDDALSGSIPGTPTLHEGEATGEVVSGFAGMANPLIQEPIAQLRGPGGQDTRTGRPIVPEGLQNIKPTSMQYRQYTSPTMAELGERLGISPLRLEHAVRSTTGGLGESISTTTDAALRKVGAASTQEEYPYEGSEKLSKIPFVGPLFRRFFVAPTDELQTRAEKKFYNHLVDGGDATDSLDKLIVDKDTRPEALKFYLNNPDKLALADNHPTLVKASQNFEAYRKTVAATLRDKSLSVSDKRTKLHEYHTLYMKRLKEVNEGMDKVLANVQNETTEQRRARIGRVLNRANNLQIEPDDTADEVNDNGQ